MSKSIPKQVFSGYCSTCGDVYQAQAKKDDLGGLQFNCKRSTCRGKVQLSRGHKVDWLKTADLQFDTSKRLC